MNQERDNWVVPSNHGQPLYSLPTSFPRALDVPIVRVYHVYHYHYAQREGSRFKNRQYIKGGDVWMNSEIPILCALRGIVHTAGAKSFADPTHTCPHCQFNLLLLPIEALVDEPDRGKKVLPRMGTANTTLIELLRSKDPETFTSKASARRALNAVGAAIFDVLSGGEGLRWGGLGSFKVRQRNPRKGRNPRTGEEFQIPARKVITFSSAKALKQRLNA